MLLLSFRFSSYHHSHAAEEGFGPRDETKLQAIPTITLPPDVREGDILGDDAGTYATVILILPEVTVIDLNHPLAGHPLFITLQVVTIEDSDGKDNTESDTEHPLMPNHSVAL